MAQLNLTLSSLSFPGLGTYTPPFGTKNNENVGLSTEQGCRNLALPFEQQRPVQVAENSTLAEDSVIESDRRIIVTASGITLSLADSVGAKNTAAFAGLKLDVIAGFSSGTSTLTYWTSASHSESTVLSADTYVTLVGDASGYWHLRERVHKGKVMNCSYTTNGGANVASSRFLVFDFTDADHRSLKVKADTHVPLDVTEGGTKTRYWWDIDEDTIIDLDGAITNAASHAVENIGVENGRDFYVYLALVSGEIGVVVSCNPDIPNDINVDYTANNTKRIGQFHTLCVDAGVSLTAIVATDSGSVAVGGTVPVKNYPSNDADGFYGFYNKSVSAVVTNATYDTVTVEHPLAGFEAGQILPESVWCLTFRPFNCKADGMVYEPDTDTAVDIYLQSGKGRNTRSVYGGTTTRGRQPINHQADMLAVGKRLPTDHEFLAFASGSNECTAIKGTAEASVVTTGGHLDTSNRRMVSFTGVEDCCGAIWQWLDEIAASGGSQYEVYDGNAKFGKSYGIPKVLAAGGAWSAGASCGSRCRTAFNGRSDVSADDGARGLSRIIRGAE